MQARLKWAVALAVIAAALALAASRLLPFEAPDPAQAGPKYKDVTAKRGAFRIAVMANGLVRPIDRIELKSKASGKVMQLPIEVGDRVEKGALIAKLDQVEERAALAQAEANLDIARAELDLAEKNFARRQQLFSSKVISKEAQDQTELDLAVARSKLVQADTALERARERVEDTVITAPVGGVILQKYVESGQIIASGVSNVGGGTRIADIADMRNVYIEAGIDEIDIGKIAVGQQAAIRAEAYPQHRYEGVVVRIAPEARVEQNVTLFDVVIQVANTDANLKSGMNTTVEIVMVDEPDALTIPVAALRRSNAGPGEPQLGGPTAVVLVKQGEDYVTREIRTGRSDHRVIEVLEGLVDGAVVGIPMVSRLKEENDFLNARMRDSRRFGSGERESRQPSDKGG